MNAGKALISLIIAICYIFSGHGHHMLAYSALSNQLILHKIMSFLSYKDAQRLSICCQVFKALSSLESVRRKNGAMTHFSMFHRKKLKLKCAVRYAYISNFNASTIVHTSSASAQQKVAETIEELWFSPKIAFIFSGNLNTEDHRKWSMWFKHLMPYDCTFMGVQSKFSVCGSVNEHVYEVHEEHGICGVAYLLFASYSKDYDIKLFKNMKDLISLTNGKKNDEQVKCIVYFSKMHSRKNLSGILSMCKKRNNNFSIAFGGLVIDSLASFFSDEYTSKIECAGLVFTGMGVKAASTIIEEMNDNAIRDSMIHFRNSIEFDITDKTKNTICFLLSCIEHSPCGNYNDDYTKSESEIFYTIFPSNVKVCGLSGHGEFGHVSGVEIDQKKIFHQFSCVIVLVQFPKK